MQAIRQQSNMLAAGKIPNYERLTDVSHHRLNQKGGSGKTTTATNLAAVGGATATHDSPSTSIPNSPRRAISACGQHRPDATVYEVLADGVDPATPSSRTRTAPTCSPAAPSARLELSLVGEVASRTASDQALADLQDDYHFFLLDTPPNLGLLTVNALVAADRFWSRPCGWTTKAPYRASSNSAPPCPSSGRSVPAGMPRSSESSSPAGMGASA